MAPSHTPETWDTSPQPRDTSTESADGTPHPWNSTLQMTMSTMVSYNSSTSSKGSLQAGNEADDAIWILTSTFIIFTMQSGFGLLESGSVSTKNEVNIMVKNAADVIFGGLTYWAFGYAFSFGKHPTLSNGFNGWGYFFVEVDSHEIGAVYAHFFFQASFATTATTIVSGSMAERTKLSSYIVFSLVNTLVYCFPAHWVWSEEGWLARIGMIDVAGAGPVHLVGGVTGLVATVMLKPRYKRYESVKPPKMGSPTNALLGTFMLWWGWLGFNCGSTFGISGYKWVLAARSAVSTLVSSVSGGAFGFFFSFFAYKHKFDIGTISNSLLGSLVGITAFCAFATPWESFIIGVGGAACALVGIKLLDLVKVDDPVGAIGVHGFGSLWSLLLIGLFAKKPDDMQRALSVSAEAISAHGLFYGGGWYLLGVQTLGAVTIIGWSAITSFILLKAVDLTLGLRVSLEEEILGADLVEHGVGDLLLLEKHLSGQLTPTLVARSHSSDGEVLHGETDGATSQLDNTHMPGSTRPTRNGQSRTGIEIRDGGSEEDIETLPTLVQNEQDRPTHTFGAHFSQRDSYLREKQLLELRKTSTMLQSASGHSPQSSHTTGGKYSIRRRLKSLFVRHSSEKGSFTFPSSGGSSKNSQSNSIPTISHSDTHTSTLHPDTEPSGVIEDHIIYNPMYNSNADTAPPGAEIVNDSEVMRT